MFVKNAVDCFGKRYYDEIDLLNTIRNSGMDVNSYLKSIQPKPQITKQYKIDDLSDDDLYVLDILEKVGGDNISDEELTEALESAKKNEKLFQKTVEGLRTQYIQLEKDQEMREFYDLYPEKFNNKTISGLFTNFIGGQFSSLALILTYANFISGNADLIKSGSKKMADNLVIIEITPIDVKP